MSEEEKWFCLLCKIKDTMTWEGGGASSWRGFAQYAMGKSIQGLSHAAWMWISHIGRILKFTWYLYSSFCSILLEQLFYSIISCWGLLLRSGRSPALSVFHTPGAEHQITAHRVWRPPPLLRVCWNHHLTDCQMWLWDMEVSVPTCLLADTWFSCAQQNGDQGFQELSQWLLVHYFMGSNSQRINGDHLVAC